MAVSSASLYALVDLLGVPVPIATLVTAEVCTLLRFLVNHYWVFGQRRPSWRQCAEYHLATAGGFITWWTISNALALLGVHYIMAGLLAVPFSAVVNLLSSFLWVWGKQRLHR
jgi:putative flippase GtrA